MKSILSKIFGWIKRHKFITLFAICSLLIAIWFLTPSSKTPVSQFATLPITRGELRQVVAATGEIMPINTILVGSQVSGNIDKIYVDFNSKVKKGDLLLTIEPSVLQASVDEAKASFMSAESQRNYAKSEFARNEMLYNDGFISRAEF